ncbi:hypothetical protein [Microbacterium sp. zg-YB36]|uniref:hypothetical protein n=1 Tax=Microbacterium sp. zg-YB36 TaxID=2969407 RepID=UPI00214B00AF|nr:hypothetical protein [Microbacterium sp. zg-YB36]MDL5351199.1 hypothetical protein [Microbacterium sp. zg-YB36]
MAELRAGDKARLNGHEVVIVRLIDDGMNAIIRIGLDTQVVPAVSLNLKGVVR